MGWKVEGGVWSWDVQLNIFMTETFMITEEVTKEERGQKMQHMWGKTWEICKHFILAKHA